jgi:hydrogenase maturation protease
MMKSSTAWKNVPTATSQGRSEIKPAATLIFTWGNPSRGDDAIGPEIYQRLKNHKLDNVELQTDFQLQIEHVIDLENRERVLFIDASVSATAPFEFNRIVAAKDDSYTTHAMSPQSLLAVYEKVNKQPAPPCYLLSVRGYEFGLGLSLSENADSNIRMANDFIKDKLMSSMTEDWQQLETGVVEKVLNLRP